jgi:hypothetical protein
MPRKKVQGGKKVTPAKSDATKKVKPEKIKQLKPGTAAVHPKG